MELLHRFLELTRRKMSQILLSLFYIIFISYFRSDVRNLQPYKTTVLIPISSKHAMIIIAMSCLLGTSEGLSCRILV
ncbi:hypothetical protein EV401DRAFT_1956704 [Pisolithus croceorrhizus]|nr:hypothetical protein EV401DRAFT_1956704 [Pisolithus croceorrhizus]